MLPLDVVGIRVDKVNNTPVVVLREVGGDRFLPIWIGAAEATAIAYAQEEIAVPRPLTHDLFAATLAALNHELEQVRITGLEDGVYFAELVFSGGITVAARPSDAIALALRTGTTIYGAEEVLEQGAVGSPAEEEVVVEQFREFLDSVSPEDFGPNARDFSDAACETLKQTLRVEAKLSSSGCVFVGVTEARTLTDPDPAPNVRTSPV